MTVGTNEENDLSACLYLTLEETGYSLHPSSTAGYYLLLLDGDHFTKIISGNDAPAPSTVLDGDEDLRGFIGD